MATPTRKRCQLKNFVISKQLISLGVGVGQWIKTWRGDGIIKNVSLFGTKDNCIFTFNN